MLLNKYEECPFKVINYLCAEINYGGRVTDYNDQRLIKSILSIYVCPEALREKYAFSVSGLYRTIAVGSHDDYIRYIEQLPL
jgi:dynein heavy chain